MTKTPACLAEMRLTWRQNWLESVAEFADLELQRRSWLGGADYNSPYWSFVEWMCRYFDDYALSSGYSTFVANGLVSQEEANVLCAFHAAVDAYKAPGGDEYDHSAIFADPAWLHVVALADAARLSLLAVIKEPSERKLLERI